MGDIPATPINSPSENSGLTEGRILPLLNEAIRHGGKVYKVPNGSGSFVAVKKVLSKSVAEEVEILENIKHPNIVKLVKHIRTKEYVLLIYEYSKYRSLDLFLDRKPTPGQTGSVAPVVLDFPTRLRIACGVAQGLNHLHKSFVYHGNLNSSNILLHDDVFSAKIANFRSARIIEKDSGYVHKKKEDDRKYDVYRFGGILLELLTGKKASYEKKHCSLVEWVGKKKIHQILDKDIDKPEYLKGNEEVLVLALSCTKPLGDDTPSTLSIENVLARLLKCNKDVVGPSRAG